MQQKNQWLERLLWHNDLEVSIINTEDRRNYFQSFKCEVLTANPQNKDLIKKFVSKKANNQLESYIKNEDKAWAEDSEGETRVYVVKDEAGDIALFFSILQLINRKNLEMQTLKVQLTTIKMILNFMNAKMMTW